VDGQRDDPHAGAPHIDDELRPDPEYVAPGTTFGAVAAPDGPAIADATPNASAIDPITTNHRRMPPSFETGGVLHTTRAPLTTESAIWVLLTLP
jgi:hypothetical protein